MNVICNRACAVKALDLPFGCRQVFQQLNNDLRWPARTAASAEG
jgi:hypothetical protein